jgi:hypothetical protein
VGEGGGGVKIRWDDDIWVPVWVVGIKKRYKGWQVWEKVV